MKNQAIQLFSETYLQSCKGMKPKQIVRFLDDYRKMILSPKPKKKLISIRVSEPLLNTFKTKAKKLNRPYQQIIQELMQDWV